MNMLLWLCVILLAVIVVQENNSLVECTGDQHEESKMCYASGKCEFGCKCFIYKVVWNALTKTMQVNVTNRCIYTVSYVAFGVPSVSWVSSPAHSIHWQGKLGTYKVYHTNQYGNPGFTSVKFEVVSHSGGFKNGGTESFTIDFKDSFDVDGYSAIFKTHAGLIEEKVKDVRPGKCKPPTVTTAPTVTTKAATTSAIPLTTAAIPVTTAATPVTTAATPVTTAATPVTTAAIPVTTAPVVATTASFGTTGNSIPFDLLCAPLIDADCRHLSFALDGGYVQPASSFHFVSFGDFLSAAADVEGRLAVRDHLHLSQGFSIGLLLSDGLSYSLIVGSNATWTSGSLSPAGSKSYVGGHFDAPAYLLATRTNQVLCDGCLHPTFDALQQCYLQKALSLQTASETASYSVIFGDGLAVTCAVNADVQYMSIPDQVLAGITWYQLSASCDLSDSFVLRIVPSVPGSDVQVSLIGSSFPAFAQLVYVVTAPGTIVTSVGIRGHILAPLASLYQTGGVLQGKVVVGNAPQVAQVNLVCVPPTPSVPSCCPCPV